MRRIGIILVTLALLLSGCSISDMSNAGTVNVAIGGSDGRYIANSTAVDEAYLGLIDEDVLYNFEELKNVTAVGGQVQYTFTGIPVGDYAFLAMLMDKEDHNLSTAIDFVTIEEGLNNLNVEMGPSFTLEIGGLDFELNDLDKVFSVSFSNGIIEIGLNVTSLLTTVVPLVNNLEVKVMDTNAKTMQVLKWDGSPIIGADFGTFNFTPPPDENNWTSNNTLSIFKIPLTTEFMIRMGSWGDLATTQKSFPDAKGYKDYKVRLKLNT